jgi:hypothetical protein
MPSAIASVSNTDHNFLPPNLPLISLLNNINILLCLRKI